MSVTKWPVVIVVITVRTAEFGDNMWRDIQWINVKKTFPGLTTLVEENACENGS